MNQETPALYVEPNAAKDSDFVLRLQRRWKTLAAFALVFAAAGTLYTVLVPPRFEAKTSIILPGTRANAAASLSQSLGLNVASGGDTSLPMFHRILESERVLDLVSQETALPKKTIRRIRTIEEDPKGNSIDITVADTHKDRALAVSTAFLKALRSVVSVVMVPSKGQRAELLADDLRQRTKELADSEKQLEQFSRTAVTDPAPVASQNSDSKGSPVVSVSPSFRYQDQLTTLSLEIEKLDARIRLSQSKAQLAGKTQPVDFPPVEAWHKQITDIQTQLAVAQSGYSDNAEEVHRLQSELAQLKTLLNRDVEKYVQSVKRNLGGSTSAEDVDRQSILSQMSSIRRLASAAPAEATQYQRLVRNVTTLSALVSQLRLQLEQAQLDRNEDPNRWEVLDPPAIGEDPVNKNYPRNVGLAAMLGLFIGAAVALRRTRQGV